MGPHWVGIDVARAWLDVACSDAATTERVANTEDAIGYLVAGLAADSPARTRSLFGLSRSA